MRNESGAGQVSLLWVVFLIVLVLGLAGFTYIAFKDKAALDFKYQTAVAKEADTFNKNLEISERINQLSAVVGYKDSPTASSSLEAVNDTISSAKDRFPDHVGVDMDTLEEIFDGMGNAYSALESQLNEAKTSLENEIELRRTAEENINTIEAEKNNRISELEAQLSDEQQRAQAQLDEDNQRISNLQEQLDEADSRAREAENTAMTQKEMYEKEISLLNTRISAQAKKLEILREPDKPDGRVLSTSSRTGLAMIDIGREHGLQRGIKFEVFRYGKGGVLIPKGMIEVQDVDAESAKCGILSTIDPLDPIVQGDVISNPHFARNMQRTFVFLGEFPATMDKKFVKDRLTALGALVGDSVDPTTDFLVLGQKERGEFATELKDMPEFKLADKLGVQMLRLRDLAAFIEY
jgi:NAD-dependent DNA ligase